MLAASVADKTIIENAMAIACQIKSSRARANTAYIILRKLKDGKLINLTIWCTGLVTSTIIDVAVVIQACLAVRLQIPVLSARASTSGWLTELSTTTVARVAMVKDACLAICTQVVSRIT